MKKPTSKIGLVNRGSLLALLCFIGLALAFISIRQATAQAQSPETPVVKGIYRGLAPVVKFDLSPPLRTMKIIPPGPGKLRENEDRDIMPPRIRFAPEWDPVVQGSLGRGNAGRNGDSRADRNLQWPDQYQRRRPTRPKRRGRPQPRRDDVQSELPDLRQDRHITFWSGRK